MGVVQWTWGVCAQRNPPLPKSGPGLIIWSVPPGGSVWGGGWTIMGPKNIIFGFSKTLVSLNNFL